MKKESGGVSFEQVLGLSRKEERLYRALGSEPLSVAEIAEKAKLPRMTTHYALQRFLKRGLVERIKRNKRFYYYKVSEVDLLRSLVSTQEVSRGEITVPIAEDSQVVIHRGWEGIYAMYERITKENARARLYTIQTTESTKHIFGNYSVEQLDAIHGLMKDNEVILEDIVEADFFDPIYQKYGKGFETAVRTFLDRLTATYVLPQNLVRFKSDMVIARNVAIFIDWKKQVAVEIRTKEIVKMFLELFQTFKSQAHYMQFRSLAQKYID